jgi:2-amino-4-hydroxy-6-hydroxymethyldihydropteridine diphosphokinase
MGNRAAHLREAIDRLAPDVRILRTSSVYETEPQDFTDQPWFLNLVVEVDTALSPQKLLARIQKVENDMGRKREIPKGPRNIDIDILLYGNEVIRTKDLEIPHPRLAQRRFVLEPLAALAPDRKHPVIRKTMRELLPATISQAIRLRPSIS